MIRDTSQKALAGLFLTGFLLLGASLSQAQVITIGTGGSANAFPFGNYQGEYQQVYASTAFSAPIAITQIAFSSANVAAPGSYSFTGTIGLGTTAATPSAPGSSYAANKRSDFLTVFNSTQNATLTASGTTFDLVFNVTPFVYDPSVGNLLLDVVTSSITNGGGSFFTASNQGTDLLVGRVYNSGGTGNPIAEANGGLRTRFSSTPISAAPEPGSAALLLPTMAFTAIILRRRKK